MNLLFFLSVLLVASLSHTASGSERAPANSQQPGETESVSSYQLKHLGASTPVRLTGTLDGQSIWFGVRSDDLVTQARLKLRFTASPALISELSHLKILLNEEVVAVIPLTREKAGTEQQQDIQIDPRYVSTSNNLRFQLVGHYTRECEDPLHTSLWASISNQSELQLNTRRIIFPDDLALLPLPFLDIHASEPALVPILLGQTDQADVLHAAGVLATWLGTRLPDRAISFQVLEGNLPERHAILLLTNDHLPKSLNLSPVEDPRILISHHPQRPEVKYLILQAKDGPALDKAAAALVLGQAVLSGASATVTHLELPPARKPYDSPNWAPTDRLTRLGDLVTDPSLLQVRGRNPQPVHFKVRIPPDILIWEKETVDLDLHIRYTPPITNGNSVVAVLANNNLVRSAYLESKSDMDDQLFRVKLASGGPVIPEDMKIPSFQIGTENDLEVKFFLGDYRQGWCQSGAIDSFLGGIDADSTIDLRGHYHLAKLPDLAAFTNGGFPYTRLADLAETTLVLNAHPSPNELEIYLGIMGQLGASTGIPAFGHRVQLGAETKGLEDRDILVISTSGTHPLISKWKDHAPASYNDEERSFGHDFAFVELFRFSDLATFTQHLGSHGRSHFRASGDLAALSGFESPLSSSRSIVSFEANTSAAGTEGMNLLRDKGAMHFVRGDVVILRNHQVESYEIGEHYYSGNIPFWMRLGLSLTRHPLITAMIGVTGGLLLSLFLYRAIQRRKRARLEAH